MSAVTDEDELNDELEVLPLQLWLKVVQAVKMVLEAHKYYGFVHFEDYADPSIDAILARATVLEAILDAVGSSDFAEHGGMMFWIENCKQSLHLIQRTHASLKAKDREEYESCIKKLDTQRKF